MVITIMEWFNKGLDIDEQSDHRSYSLYYYWANLNCQRAPGHSRTAVILDRLSGRYRTFHWRYGTFLQNKHGRVSGFSRGECLLVWMMCFSKACCITL